jgi:hypothetical protein
MGTGRVQASNLASPAVGMRLLRVFYSLRHGASERQLHTRSDSLLRTALIARPMLSVYVCL